MPSPMPQPTAALTWALCETPAHAWATPPDTATAAAAHWLPASVPGTAALALAQAGQWHADTPRPLHDRDVWYRCTLNGHGPHTLAFDGLATVTNVYLDDHLLATSTSMFAPLVCTATLRGGHTLWLAFRSLNAHLASLKLPRARWRVAMVPQQALRGVRTTLLGHMPSWCPAIDTVGPWRPAQLHGPNSIWGVQLAASLSGVDGPGVGNGNGGDVDRGGADGGSQTFTGTLRVSLRCAHDLSGSTITCAGQQAPLLPDLDGAAAATPASAFAAPPGEATQHWHATLTLPQPERWWPRGHGPAMLHTVQLTHAGGTQPLGQVGFRTVAVDTGADGQGFALRINGLPVFARGAVFTPPNPLHPGGEAGVAERLAQLADMGANMVRVAGPFCYESPAFFQACDALGLLVWQDLMLANFDHPLAQPAFAHALQCEAEHLLRSLAGHPSVAVLCGGSEVAQQAAMLGVALPAEAQRFFRDTWPGWCQRWCPGVAVVPNSPSGGELPFSVRSGIAHCFGVGAYERPLDDARRGAPRFAAECLAFAHVPEPCSLAALDAPAVHHPHWKAGVPRDRHASWDFEDTRDHYLHRVFGLDAAALRRTDAAHYLQASRALTAHIVAQTLSEWRHPGSPTAGALVFTAADLQPGAGWGLIAADGEPKAAYHGFKQVAQPLALLLTDEGCDGLDIHLVNDTPTPQPLNVHVQVLRHGRVVVAQGSRAVTVAAHGALSLSATQVLGHFLDLTYAFRFGPPGHDAVVVSARPVAAPEAPLQAVHFPLGPYTPPSALGLSTRLEHSDGQWWLWVDTDALARFVHINSEHHRPQDNWFHLPPGAPRRVALWPRHAGAPAPAGTVSALNATDVVSHQGTA